MYSDRVHNITLEEVIENEMSKFWGDEYESSEEIRIVAEILDDMSGEDLFDFSDTGIDFSDLDDYFDDYEDNEDEKAWWEN